MLPVPLLQQTRPWPRWTPPPTAYHGPLSPRTNRRHLAILEASNARDVLDWGCGTAEYRPLVQDVLSRRYVGFDVAGDDADVLGDAHRLPFRAASFDYVLTSAALEHVANPFVAVREVARVLRPGGVFSGSVAFLEPYHASSYFHLTGDAVVHVLATSGLDVEGIWPQEGWTVFDSLATMPGPVSAVSRRGLRLLGSWERFVRARHLHPRAIRTGRWLRRRTGESSTGSCSPSPARWTSMRASGDAGLTAGAGRTRPPSRCRWRSPRLGRRSAGDGARSER